MPRQTHAQKQVPAFPAALARFTLARQTNALSFTHTARNFYLIRFGFLRTSASQRNLSRRTMQRFLQRHHDIGFDIVPAFRRYLSLAKSAEGRAPATPTEKGFKEIAEPGAAKFKLDAAIFSGTPAEPAARLTSAPLRRWLKSAGLVPMLAQLVIFSAFLRVA